MRRLVYLVDSYPCLSQTFTLEEVRGLREAGLPLRVVTMHDPGPHDPAADPELDPSVTRLASLASPAPWLALLYWLVRRPPTLLSLLIDVLRPHTSPFLLRFQLRSPLHLAWGALLAREVDEHDNLHSQFLFAASTVAWVASRLSGASFSFTCHGDHGLLLARPKLRDARRVIAISESEKTRLHAHRPGLPDDRVVVHRLGVAVPEACPELPADGPPDSPLRLLAVGSLGPVKGHDVLLRALALVRDEGEPVHLDLVGDGPERARLEALVTELKLEEQVTLHGAIPHARALALRDAAHLSVLACRVTDDGDHDGIPIALMEGMAAGRPVVSTRLSGIPELVEDGVSGLLATPDDARSFADALLRLVRSEADRTAMGRAAWERVRERHERGRSRENAARLFQAILEDRRPDLLS
ncbi:MAG: glycosyltransferase [Acidobacteriota bacterium]